MTLANSKRLYEHYVATGYEKAAEDMLIKYPEFASNAEPKKEKIKKSE